MARLEFELAYDNVAVLHFSHNITETPRGLVSWLVVFYGISTTMGYLMPNLVYIYILNI